MRGDFNGKWVCAEVWVGNDNGKPGRWEFTVWANEVFPTPSGGVAARTIGYSRKSYFKLNGWDRQCIQLIRVTGVSKVKQVEAHVYYGPLSRAFIGVSKIWFQDNL
jgi:hypothetical protein